MTSYPILSGLSLLKFIKYFEWLSNPSKKSISGIKILKFNFKDFKAKLNLFKLTILNAGLKV